MMLHSNQTQQQQQVPKIPTVQQVESQMKIKLEEEEDSGLEMMGRTEDSDESQEKESKMNGDNKPKQNDKVDEKENGAWKEKPGKKLSEIAMKLKLSLTKDTPSQKISPMQVHKVVAPRFNKLAQGESQVHSVMIGGLFRGLTQNDLVGYFGRFGNVVDYSEPVSSYSQNDGTKFVFLKFADPRAVERVVGKFSVSYL
jgi:RNA recognition motif. (a.k.a. RRM, RBD, or RNP domain)